MEIIDHILLKLNANYFMEISYAVYRICVVGLETYWERNIAIFSDYLNIFLNNKKQI